MTETDKEKLIRQYAADEITWRALRERGFDNYMQVLGELGLRPPVAPMEGPNIEARQRGRAIIRESVAGASVSKPYSLIVTDTSPLFTLALAGSLDVLLRTGLPVRSPDAVFSRRRALMAHREPSRS
jgi:hypothetical protein